MSSSDAYRMGLEVRRGRESSEACVAILQRQFGLCVFHAQIFLFVFFLLLLLLLLFKWYWLLLLLLLYFMYLFIFR